MHISLCLQGAIYIMTGVWPLIHISSFMGVTGPKTDLWLVKTVGMLVSVIGFVLMIAAFRRMPDLLFFWLAIGAALALAVIDLIYVGQGVISRVYLLDAVLETMLALFVGLDGYRTHSARFFNPLNAF